MTTNSGAAPRVEDLASVGTRISWGAILAGAMIALGMYFLLSTLAGAVGMSVSDRVNPTKLEIGAVVWTFLTTVAALFVGGVVTSLFTAGENKTEAMLYGAIMWAVLIVLLLVLGSVGVRTGFNAMAASAHTAQTTPVVVANNTEVENRKELLEASTRLTWYVFAGTWVSMLAAVAGALVGAGPTFRVVTITPTQRVVVT
jgi:ABC-type transport system involved in multi-copper enzyme maturation permease subunit